MSGRYETETIAVPAPDPQEPRFQRLKEIASQAPVSPGVYQMCDQRGQTLYVGKAKNLRKRVSSYFRDVGHERALTQLLVRNIESIRFLITHTESEALLLENNLIKKERPKYNVRLRDDKDYICLRLSVKHPYPRLTVVRRPKLDGAKYFGPYVSGFKIRNLTRYLLKLFPLRSCSDAVIQNRSRPCILYDIKLCTAPCVKKISRDDYQALVEEVRLFLEGNTAPLRKQIKAQMQRAAKNMEYDRAAALRDWLLAIEASQEEQNVVFHDHRDVDVLGVAKQQAMMVVVLLTVRDGKIIGKRDIHWDLIDSDHEQEAIETLLAQHYLTDIPFVPPQILVPQASKSLALLAKACREKMGRKVEFVVPERGRRIDLIKMAKANADEELTRLINQGNLKERLLMQVQQELSLPERPLRIEAFDISNIQGTDPVASQVTFVNGEARKADYRKYKIKSVSGANDFAMMQEVLSRRFQNREPSQLPQLVLIDGGKGQLNAAQAVLRELELDLPLAAIAKMPLDALQKRIESDRIFIPGRKNPLNLKSDSPVLRLFQRMRDEAHRFAITFHRLTKKKSTLTSRLGNIAGIGKQRQRQLLQQFGSLTRLKAATLKELQALPYLSSKLAEKLFAALKTFD